MDAPVNLEDDAGNSAILHHALGHDGDALVAAAGKVGLRNHTLFATSGVSGRTKFVCLSGEAALASAHVT